jgi:DNA mismatch endonuclease (patch repair protein)
MNRSQMMAAVRSKNTKPELLVRRLAHAMGYRFRLHRNDLPGTPDIVFPGKRKVIFVHGCFWHSHEGCKRAARPASNIEFWDRKLNGNVRRDQRDYRKLKQQGWKILTIWQCQTTNAGLEHRLRRFLE